MKFSRKKWNCLRAAIEHGPICKKCDGMLQHLPFCITCGEANPHFNKEVFLHNDGRTIEENLVECKNGHPSKAQENPEDFEGFPYCGRCGEKVYVW